MRKDTISKFTLFLAIGTILVLIFLIIQIAIFAVETKQTCRDTYNKSLQLFEQGKYTEGFNKLQEMPNYENYDGVDELLEKYNICPYCGSIGSGD